MADMMPKKNYDLTEITKLLLEMRENCIPKDGDAYEDPNRAEKYDALNAAIDLINNPSMLAQWISVKDRLPDGEVLAANFAHGTYGYKEYIIGYLGAVKCTEPDWYSGKCYAENDHEILDDVTHWMPLPEAPKEEEE